MVFNIEIPKALDGADLRMLNPRNAWAHEEVNGRAHIKEAGIFAKDFVPFINADNGRLLDAGGPEVRGVAGKNT